RRFAVKDYVEQIIVSLRPHLKNTQHQIELDISETLIIESYPGYFSQIFTNLIMNSLIHGFQEGMQGQIRVSVKLEANSLQFDYYDNGKGIAASIKPKIFDPFVTTNRQQGGSGLGTYILYNIVTQALQGQIALLDDTSTGVHFRIMLPTTGSQSKVFAFDEKA
ncbi:HAMP domain-containing sensor histidine kinase, partial [Arthrospira platensis SPKY1]|nr:HAMP domain-containing sensor histidine kinase [Arthrospira platensis SPKY1]